VLVDRLLRLAARVSHGAFLPVKRRQPPRLPLGDPEQPPAPAALRAVGLILEELYPGVPARVLDGLARRAGTPRERPDEFEVELRVEVELVSAEP
jgi:hypothetical protein